MQNRTPFLPTRPVQSAAFQLGVRMKNAGFSRTGNLTADICCDQLGDAYDVSEWTAGWDSADVVLAAVLDAKCGIPVAIANMSDDQLAREERIMKVNWYVALKPWSNESAWQRAIVSELTRRRNAVREAAEQALELAFA